MYKACCSMRKKCFRLHYCPSTTYVEIQVITKNFPTLEGVYVSFFVKLLNLLMFFSTFVTDIVLHAVLCQESFQIN